MGYTHYFNRRRGAPPARRWAAAVRDCRTLVARLRADGLALCREYDEPNREPGLGPAAIQFNGPGAAGHETFVVAPDDSGGSCKTARKPYDLAVCGCLVALARHLGEAFLVASDGDDAEENWPAARALCRELFGYGDAFTVTPPPPRLTRRGLLGRAGAPTRHDSGEWTTHHLTDGTYFRTSRRTYCYRDDRPLATGGYVERYRHRPFAAETDQKAHRVLVPSGRVRVTGPDGVAWYAASGREATAEATKLTLRRALWRHPGAAQFLPAVLHAHPDVFGLSVWLDWLSERSPTRAVVLARRDLLALLPRRARGPGHTLPLPAAPVPEDAHAAA